MTITLQPVDPARDVGSWPMPLAPPFLEGEAYRALVRDLERYVRGEISGRSYLVAGHRGSGKTALVTRAVQDLRQRLLDESVRVVGPGEPAPVLRRPLIVRLYGPALVTPLALTDAERQARKEAAETAAKLGLFATSTEGEAPSPEQLKATQAALVQITVALYRSLAAELSLGYLVHARAQSHRRSGEPLEIAAQLALELDTVTSPGLLRSFWARIGRLRRGGVLWPPEADRNLLTADQGLREVIAAASASQAFEVCSGAVNAHVKTTDAAGDDQKVGAKGTADIREIVGRLGTLGVGALTGAALWNGNNEVAAIVTGLAVWLLGTATLSWSFDRYRKSDVTSDYTFIPDRSVQTLDRDLPLVIERVRDAGLWPVFVIDELDKLESQKVTIGQIIRRLKHIVADNGFFCFLSDRSYFEFVEGEIREQPFPPEHTYFTERRLVSYGPEELRDFVAAQFVRDDATEADNLYVEAFARWATHSGKANFTTTMRAFGRFLSEAMDAEDAEGETPDDDA